MKNELINKSIFYISSAIDIDVKHKRVYWADVKLRTINRIFLNGSMPERVVSFGLQTPEGNCSNL